MNTEILNHGTYQQIIYRTDDGNHCRTLITDLDGNIIQDELVEYDDDGKLVADVVFAPDHTTIIAKREYTDDGFRDYRLKDDKLTLVQFMVRQWLEPNQKSKKGFITHKASWCDADENIGMVWTGTFDNLTFMMTRHQKSSPYKVIRIIKRSDDGLMIVLLEKNIFLNLSNQSLIFLWV